MQRIDDIIDLKNKCTGCMACVDVCPTKCITSFEEKDGFKYTKIEEDKCISCGKCYSICPIETHDKGKEEQHLYASYSLERKVQNDGSSGGVFEELALYFLSQGYYVSGAAFEGTTLKHAVINKKEQIKPLLKSKYIQSNLEGVYNKIIKLLKDGEKVFFCGTPCQVSALKNQTPNALKSNLFTADMICHGVPSQKMFDDYIKTLEKKHGGKVTEFSFRVKDNKYKHAHGYRYKIEKKGKIKVKNGIYTTSTFYNAFKKYIILREGCYNCQYTTLERVSDITLADFWGIEKYDFKANIDTGVSMIITNTSKGNQAFLSIIEKLKCKEFPIEYGVESNHCLTKQTKRSKKRDAVINEYISKGYERTAKKYFKSSLMQKAYWLIPSRIRSIIRKIRG